MSEDDSQTPPFVPPREQPIPVDIEDEMKRSYLDYAMSVIVGRALPDVRDGLKPVHRRVLYGMWESGNRSDRPYKKSARIVGAATGRSGLAVFAVSRRRRRCSVRRWRLA